MKEFKHRILESRDGRCPYCRSSFVMEVSAEEAEAILKTIEGAGDPDRIRIYKCYSCNKYFFTRKPA